MKHKLKAKKYLRYGDDFVIVENDLQKIKNYRVQTIAFLMRVKERVRPGNFSSYSGLIKKHGNSKQIKRFNWLVFEKLL